MKRGILFFVLIISLIIINHFASAQTLENTSITGNMIVDPLTGKLTSQQVGLSIFVQTVVPYINILSPKNQTYLKNESIPLSYNLYDGDSIWYSLDDSPNITLYSSININVSQGQHTLRLFSNKSENITTASVIFTTNSSRFTIFFEKYKGVTKGSSTNFLDYTYEDIQNLQEITLENTSYGKIIFMQVINTTNDRINTDDFLDLDSNTNISFNNIKINSTELPNFNKSATIWMYGLNFVNPRILKDGAICPSNTCIKESYTSPSGAGGNGILKFNVTGFSNYSSEETPSTNDTDTNPPSEGNTGGGGGSKTQETIKEIVNETKIDNLTVISREMKITVKQGKTIGENIYILNNNPYPIKIKVYTTGISEFISLSETEFTLDSGQSKTLNANFTTDKNTPPDNYIGKVLIETDNGELYDVLISMNVQSEESLFDVLVKLNEKKLPVYKDEAVWFTITIRNLGEEKGINLNLKYTIKDTNGKVIFEGEGTDKIDTYLEKNGKIKLPKNIALGKYILSVKIDYNGKIAVTSASFDVKKRNIFTLQNILIVLGIIILILVILGITGKREKAKAKREQERKMETLEN